MYTQCPQCDALMRVTAENLRFAMGMVRCTRCATIFNALATLREEAGLGDAQAVDVGVQLPFVQLGDVAILDSTTSRALLQRLREADARATRTPLPASAALPGAAPRAPAMPPSAGPATIEIEAAPDGAEALARGHKRSWSLLGLLPADILLASRNLLRNRKRSALALGAIGFGVIALMLGGGFLEWVMWAMRESAIQGRLGHIQVTEQDFLSNGVADPFAYLLPQGSKAEQDLTKWPHVSVLAPRLAFSGLASHGDVTMSYLAEGVDPVKEAKISVDFRIASGKPLAETDPKGIIVGIGLAELLGVAPGDALTLLATTESGGLNGIDTHVRGIFSTSNKVWNDSSLRLPLTTARELLRVNGAHTWVLLLDDTHKTEAVLAQLNQSQWHTKAGLKLEFTPWTKLADFYNKTVALFSSQMNVVRFIIGVIIALSISNVLVMGVLQRTSEIGTLMAIGLRRRKILQLFISEGMLLGLLGGAIGVSSGYLLGEFISFIGIPMPPAPGMDKGFTGEIMVTWPTALSAFVLAVVTTLLASVYPAWKASRLEIVNALRHSK